MHRDGVRPKEDHARHHKSHSHSERHGADKYADRIAFLPDSHLRGYQLGHRCGKT